MPKNITSKYTKAQRITGRNKYFRDFLAPCHTKCYNPTSAKISTMKHNKNQKQTTTICTNKKLS